MIIHDDKDNPLYITANKILIDRLEEFNSFKYNYKENCVEIINNIYNHKHRLFRKQYEYTLRGVMLNKYEAHIYLCNIDAANPYIEHNIEHKRIMENGIYIAERKLYKMNAIKYLLAYFPAIIYDINSEVKRYYINSELYSKLETKYRVSLPKKKKHLASDYAKNAYNNYVLKLFKRWMKKNVHAVDNYPIIRIRNISTMILHRDNNHRD